MRRVLLFAICVSSLTLILSFFEYFFQGQTKSIERIEHVMENAIVIGLTSHEEPFSYTNVDGEMEGFDLELSQAICSRLKWNCRFLQIPAGELSQALATKKVDIIIGDMGTTVAPHGARYSNPYIYSRYWAITSDESLHNFDANETKGRTIIVRSGTSETELVHSHFESAGEIKEVADVDEFFELLRSEEGSIGVIDTLLAMSELMKIENDPLYPQIFLPHVPAHRRMAVRYEDGYLLQDIDPVLHDLRLSGPFSFLFFKYFKFVSY